MLDYLEKHGFRDSAAALRSEVASNPNLPTANVPFDLPAAFLHEWYCIRCTFCFRSVLVEMPCAIL